MNASWIYGLGLTVLLALLTGCGAGEPVSLDPPDGWEGSETRWWRAGVDTAGLFREMEGLGDMGLQEEAVFAADLGVARSAGLAQEQIAQAVKRSLIRLYRNEPQVVDSLFERFVMPKIEATPLSGNLGDYVEQFKREGYNQIRNHFREPLAARSLGKDIPVVYPDSLRRRDVSGTVYTQVYLNEGGEPVAIELLEGVHPVLNASAMHATTQMRWSPAYLLRSGNWRAIPSWARFNIVYRGRP